MPRLVLFVVVLFAYAHAFRQSLRPRSNPNSGLWSSVTSSSEQWQGLVESVLDVDTSCESRTETLKKLTEQRYLSQITNDVVEAIRERDVTKVAPRTRKYGKDLAAFQAFQKQLISDIIPDLLKRGPGLLAEAPRLVNEVVKQGPSRGSKLVETLQELSSDASFLQSTVDELKREVKNIVKTTPEGLATPAYKVLVQTESYEVREYEAFAVCSTSMGTNSDVGDVLASGNGFNKLAGYVLEGENESSTKMSMTTPVITSQGQMQFVMPLDKNAETAPKPTNSDVTIKNVEKSVCAVREFTGLATDAEVSKQRAALEDALLADSIAYDNLSFSVLQYNPPYTLPWLRRNEVSLRVMTPIVASSFSESDNDFASDSNASVLFAEDSINPEAGD